MVVVAAVLFQATLGLFASAFVPVGAVGAHTLSNGHKGALSSKSYGDLLFVPAPDGRVDSLDDLVSGVYSVELANVRRDCDSFGQGGLYFELRCIDRLIEVDRILQSFWGSTTELAQQT